MKRTAVAALVLISLLAGACRRASREPVRVVTSAEVAGTGLAQRLTATFHDASGVAVELRVVDADSLRTSKFDRGATVVMTNDQAVVNQLRPRARLAAPFARADYIIVGPGSDPARIKGARTAAEAFARIASAKRAFCAPVDVPRYRAREAAIWAEAGVDPKTNHRYRPCRGDGRRLIGDTASRNGYTIIDRSVVSAVGKQSRLAVLFEGTPMLRNDYWVMLIAGRRKAPPNAEWFVQWVMSHRGRSVVEQHRIDGERRFFNP